ncbi:hypothetical protein F4774DRAFT_367194 [Daldinia eschscholtzii]|nr:hypothetical protein F4774DRAFT_367194 [Daldinia eschscholtzii]
MLSGKVSWLCVLFSLLHCYSPLGQTFYLIHMANSERRKGFIFVWLKTRSSIEATPWLDSAVLSILEPWAILVAEARFAEDVGGNKSTPKSLLVNYVREIRNSFNLRVIYIRGICASPQPHGYMAVSSNVEE